MERYTRPSGLPTAFSDTGAPAATYDKIHALGSGLRKVAVLRSINPALASMMGQALRADLAESALSDVPLRELGIEPRPASAYISEVVAQAGGLTRSNQASDQAVD